MINTVPLVWGTNAYDVKLTRPRLGPCLRRVTQTTHSPQRSSSLPLRVPSMVRLRPARLLLLTMGEHHFLGTRFGRQHRGLQQMEFSQRWSPRSSRVKIQSVVREVVTMQGMTTVRLNRYDGYWIVRRSDGKSFDPVFCTQAVPLTSSSPCVLYIDSFHHEPANSIRRGEWDELFVWMKSDTCVCVLCSLIVGRAAHTTSALRGGPAVVTTRGNSRSNGTRCTHPHLWPMTDA